MYVCMNTWVWWLQLFMTSFINYCSVKNNSIIILDANTWLAPPLFHAIIIYWSLFTSICVIYGVLFMFTVHPSIHPSVDPLIYISCIRLSMSIHSFVHHDYFTGYMAPEVYVLPRHVHGFPSDWFALGVTLHELVTGRRPFESRILKGCANGVLPMMFNLQYLNECSYLSSQCKNFITRLLHVQVG